VVPKQHLNPGVGQEYQAVDVFDEVGLLAELAVQEKQNDGGQGS